MCASSSCIVIKSLKLFQESQPIVPAATATADWLRTQQILHQTHPISTQAGNDVISNESGSTSRQGETKQAPTQADFKVPQNQIEHNLIIARLVEGDSTPAEAELLFNYD